MYSVWNRRVWLSRECMGWEGREGKRRKEEGGKPGGIRKNRVDSGTRLFGFAWADGKRGPQCVAIQLVHFGNCVFLVKRPSDQGRAVERT